MNDLLGTNRSTAWPQTFDRAAGMPGIPEVDRWENEGGHSPGESPIEPAPWTMLPIRVDEREEAIMNATSVEGRPPSRSLLQAEWTWMLIGAGVLLAGGVIAALILLDLPTLATGLSLLVLLALAASPVWLAALMRAAEHQRARAEAEAVDDRGEPTIPTTPGQHAQVGDHEVVIIETRQVPREASPIDAADHAATLERVE